MIVNIEPASVSQGLKRDMIQAIQAGAFSPKTDLDISLSNEDSSLKSPKGTVPLAFKRPGGRQLDRVKRL